MKILAYLACMLYAAWQVPSLQAEEWTIGHSVLLSSKGVMTTATLMSERHEMSDRENEQKQRALEHKWRINQKLNKQILQHHLEENASQAATPAASMTREICNVLTGAQLSKPKIGPNFTAITYADGDPLVPPDANGSVGPTQYIAWTNNWIRSFNKETGEADGVLNLSPESFFASILPPSTPDASYFVGDPRLLYDAHSRRWFAIMITLPVNGEGNLITNNQIVLAVSDKESKGVITANTEWELYSFFPAFVGERSLVSAINNNYFADFPTLGLDRNALYIGANVFLLEGDFELFITSDLFVINKKTLLEQETLEITPFRFLSTYPLSPFVTFPLILPTCFAPQPAINFDKHAKHGFVIGMDIAHSHPVLYLIGNPGSNAPSISAPIPIPVPEVVPPGAPFSPIQLIFQEIGVPAKGTIGRLDTVGLRLSAAHVRNHKLYTSQSVSVDHTGTSTANPFILDRTGSRWYEISVKHPLKPELIDYGTLFDSRLTPTPLNYWMSSVMTNHYQTLFIGSSVAGVNAFANAAFAYRIGKGTLSDPKNYTYSHTAYNLQPNNFIKRWGDYSTLSADPTSKGSVWSIQEFCNAVDSWGVQVVEIKQKKS